MNIEKNLIIVKGEDQTYKIEYCKYENGKYSICYNEGKIYRYNYNNVIWLRNPIEINIENKLVYSNNKVLSGIIKLLRFDNYIKVIYKNNFSEVFHKNEITIEESCLSDKRSRNCFEYFKELSKSIGLSVNGDKTFLGEQYDKISFISPKSALAYYLNPKKINKRVYNRNIIFPFGFNLSQKEATEKALSNSISIIEGPPGTGKTQTILNIIANLVLNGNTVAVVSNNNSAIDNIYEKLKKNEFDFICATLGKKENKKNFLDNQNLKYTDMSSWKLENEEIQTYIDELEKSKDTLDKMLHNKNYLSKLREEYNEIDIEYSHFIQEHKVLNTINKSLKRISKLDSDKLMNLIVDIKLNVLDNEKITFKNKIRNLFKYGIINFKLYNIPLEELIDYGYNQYYISKKIEINKKIKDVEKSLINYNFDEEMSKFSEKSSYIFKNYLAKKYEKNNERPQFTEEDLWRNFYRVMNEYPVILSTTHSIKNCIGNKILDYIIIDEASQVDLLTGVLALSCAKNIVVVGDLKQLTNVIELKDINISKEILKKYELNEVYDFTINNLLLSISKLDKDIPRTLLREHYRCHSKIIGYCNKKFYNDELIVLTEENENDAPLILYKTNVGNHARGNINQRQTDIIINEIIPSINYSKSIGVIAPYRDQVMNISKFVDEKFEVDTVHKFQGREKDIIILSTVANNINDFIDNSNIINVAVSRAVKKLIVVTADFEKTNSNIGDLIKYIQYNNLEIIESKTSSIFDLLYKSYSNKLFEVLKKENKISKFNSENLMYILIKEILKEQKYSMLDVAIQVPLRMTIKDINKLTENEKKFVLNPWTHNDFVIFNKFNKNPLLAIEVDGYKFHEENEKQIERDKMKDEILNKYDIPIIRFKTNGSEEKKKLIEKIDEILNL